MILKHCQFAILFLFLWVSVLLSFKFINEFFTISKMVVLVFLPLLLLWLSSKESACQCGAAGSIPGLGRSPGRGNGNPLQYSCLESPVDRGTWWAIVHGVTKSRILLSDWAHTRTFMCEWDLRAPILNFHFLLFLFSIFCFMVPWLCHPVIPRFQRECYTSSSDFYSMKILPSYLLHLT